MFCSANAKFAAVKFVSIVRSYDDSSLGSVMKFSKCPPPLLQIISAACHDYDLANCDRQWF